MSDKPTSTCTILEKTATSIRFKATSNNVAPTPLESGGKDLRNVIEASTEFQDAFKSTRSQGKAVIMQSSQADGPVYTSQHGLVSAIMDAYNKHHCLAIRPDDVWQAILTQFSFYVNANAEELRDSFVDFKGQKALVVTMSSADFATFARRMVDEQIATNLKDEEVTQWLLPNFTTTTNNDRVAASISIMSTLQSYFYYVCCFACGIPEVTLEGTVDDWRILRKKIDRLPMYDVDSTRGIMKKWVALLTPVLDEFVASVEGNPSLHFWDTVVSDIVAGSGATYVSGWATVFACFDGKGTWKGSNVRGQHKWPTVKTEELPVGAVSVPVLLDDDGTQYDTQMLAGQFAYETTDSNTTIHPRTDWCIAYQGQPKANPVDYTHGEIYDPPVNPSLPQYIPSPYIPIPPPQKKRKHD